VSKPTLVVFLGGLGESVMEVMVGEARRAAALDTIEAALGTGAFAGGLLVTDVPAAEPIDGLETDVDDGAFHFGRRLAGVVRGRELRSVVYMGGGSAPLLSPEELSEKAAAVAGGRVVTNNRYSSDLVGFNATPEVLKTIEGVERDNALAAAFVDAGQEVEELPRSVATLFDIDGPADLAVLKVTGRGGRRLSAHVGSLDIDKTGYERVLPVFLDREKQVIVAGRVGSHTWRYLETETACRVRLFAEERGMEADGRADEGKARSLLGFHLEAVGVERLFETLAELGDAAFIDSRVLAAHAGARPSREDRFLSDLGRWKEIGNPFLRELTRAAAEAPIPVLLGGHSLMSGALMLLNEHAWRLRDEGRL
jgi:hypothetical protein